MVQLSTAQHGTLQSRLRAHAAIEQQHGSALKWHFPSAIEHYMQHGFCCYWCAQQVTGRASCSTHSDLMGKKNPFTQARWAKERWATGDCYLEDML